MIQEIQQNPLVSVFIPSYNHSRYIQTTLEGIFAQTYRNIQLIIIDDGSTDNSPEIIEKALKNCPFESELIVRPNKGIVPTLLEGLAMARGEYFASTASDDLWLPNFLERRVAQLQENHNAVLAYGHCFRIDENDKVIDSSSDWVEYGSKSSREELLELTVPQSSTIVHRKSVLDSHPWSQSYPEDLDLYLRLCSLGEFVFDSQINSAYRIHPTNTSKQVEPMLKGLINVYQLNAVNLGLNPDELNIIKRRIEWHTVVTYLNNGQRVKAIKAALRNSSGEISFIERMRQYSKILIPSSILTATRKRIKRNSNQWRGLDVKDLMKAQAATRKIYHA